MEIDIVATRLEHIDGFRRALDIVARERRYLALLEAPPLPRMREFVKDILSNGDVQVVALAEGEVVVWCDILRLRFASRAHRGTLDMGIVPAYRGRRIGPKLLAAALAAARAAHFVRVELDVHADNARAIALYEKAGFVRESIVRDAVFIEGEYRDAITMAIVDRANAA